MKITYCKANDNGQGHYRMENPARLMSQDHQVECRKGFNLSDRLLVESDLVILQMQAEESWIGVIEEGHKNGCKYAYELDDNIFAFPKDFILKKFWTNEVIGKAAKVIKACDAVITSTVPLAYVVGGYSENVNLMPNFITAEPDGEFQEHKNVRIGWAGSGVHNIDFDNYVVNALLNIKEIYGDRVELIFVGWMPPALRGIASFFPFRQPGEYLNFMRTLGIDIGIAPCKTFDFNQKRSNVKFLEYSINKTVTVASDIYPYRTSIPMSAGYVVRNKTHEWIKTLSNLIENGTTRKRMAETAYSFVKRHYMLADQKDRIQNMYIRIMN